MNLAGAAERYTIRRFIGEVKNRYNYAIKANAEHQLGYFLMPYSEERIVRAAYKASFHIGLGAKLQAEMIASIDPYLGEFTHTLGFAPCREPLRYKCKRLVLGQLPYWVALLKRNRRGYGVNGVAPSHYRVMTEKSPIVCEHIRYLDELFPRIRWRKMYWHDLAFDCAVYLGAVLKEFDKSISLE